MTTMCVPLLPLWSQSQYRRSVFGHHWPLDSWLWGSHCRPRHFSRAHSSYSHQVQTQGRYICNQRVCGGSRPPGRPLTFTPTRLQGVAAHSCWSQLVTLVEALHRRWRWLNRCRGYRVCQQVCCWWPGHRPHCNQLQGSLWKHGLKNRSVSSLSFWGLWNCHVTK